MQTSPLTPHIAVRTISIRQDIQVLVVLVFETAPIPADRLTNGGIKNG